MGTRKYLKANSAIANMCLSQELDPDVIYNKAKLLLESYRNLCWTSFGIIGENNDDLGNNDTYYIDNNEILSGLEYLNSYSPNENRVVFEKNLRKYFDTQWLIDLISNAIVQVNEFPTTGELYVEILSKFYLSRFKLCESDLLSLLNLERSRYYDRKREAVMIFAIALWGTVIPNLLSTVTAPPDSIPILPVVNC